MKIGDIKGLDTWGNDDLKQFGRYEFSKEGLSKLYEETGGVRLTILIEDDQCHTMFDKNGTYPVISNDGERLSYTPTGTRPDEGVHDKSVIKAFCEPVKNVFDCINFFESECDMKEVMTV